MSAVTPCTPCCSTPQSVQIPGVEGANGANGIDGLNAYTATTADFVTPADNATVPIFVGSTLWLVVGQTVIVGQGIGAALAGPGPGTFKVDSIVSATQFVGKFLHFSGDVGNTVTISAGATVSPAGGLFTTPLSIALGGTGGTSVSTALAALGLGFNPSSVYGFGAIGSTAYVMTAAVADDVATQVTINGTLISIPIPRAGTYLLQGFIKFDYNAATWNASRQINAHLRNTNTAANIVNATGNLFTQRTNNLAVTVITYTEGIMTLPPVVATLVNTDVITMMARVAVLPDAGTLEVAESSIVATKLF